MKNATSLATWLEFGIPEAYVNAWTSFVNSGPFNATLAQVAQYNYQANQSIGLTVQAQTPAPYRSIALAYQNQFYLAWNRTFSASSYNQFQLLLVPDNNGPLLRAQNVTKGNPTLPTQPPYYNITLPFFQSLGLDPQTQTVFLGAAKFFNLYPVGSSANNWNDPNAIRAFVVNTLAQSFNANSVQTTVIGQIYDLGPMATSASFTAFSGNILRSYNIGNPASQAYPIHPSHAVYSQFISANNDTQIIILDFKTNGLDPKNSIEPIRTDVKNANVFSNQNLAVYVTGAPAFNYDIETESVRDVERIDPITVLLIFIIIGLFFASIAAPFVPVTAIGLSVGVSFGLVYIIGSFFTSIHFLVLTLLPVAMFGAGSDYCIFLVSRYAEERRMGRGKKDAVERAVTWAGESITTSGATVVIAFGSLAIASFGMLRSIGIAVMLGISVALLVSITLVPAALSLFGDRIFWPSSVGLWRKKREKGTSYYSRAAKFTAQHSKLILLVALAVSLPATSTVLSSTTSHDFIAQVPDALESKIGYNSMSQGFGAGAITPTYTIVETPVFLVTDNWINITALQAFSHAENATLAIPGVSKVYGLTHPSGEPIPYFAFNQLNQAEQQAMIRSMKPFLGMTGKSAMVWAVLSNEPYSDPAIETLSHIRNNLNTLRTESPLLASSTLLVGGATASVADLVNSSGRDYFNMTTLVLIGVFIVLLVALGSVFTPLRLIFTILLSISWAMAAVLYISQNILGAQLIWILPIMLLVIMVGLGLDYDIFLVTRIREYVAGGSKDEEAIESAVEHTGGVITASGLVTAGAFGTMMLSRIPMLQQLGLAIFIVVLLDATLIRIYLVPSIMMHMKRLNWWAPGPLRRIPVRPEEKLIPPIPLKTKLAVTIETLAIVLLGTAIYLDYANNVYLQNFVNKTVFDILAGINVWTGVILGITSFLATYFLLQGKFRRGRFTEKMRAKLHLLQPAKIASLAPGLPSRESALVVSKPTPSPRASAEATEAARQPAEKKKES
jgi:RND superfamily putative drug exporter